MKAAVDKLKESVVKCPADEEDDTAWGDDEEYEEEGIAFVEDEEIDQ